MEAPYKLKHLPSGLYYQPFRHMGSNLSKRGKIYQTKGNILSLAYFSNGQARQILTVFAHESTLAYKEFKDKFNWQKSTSSNQMKADTLASDWAKEYLTFS